MAPSLCCGLRSPTSSTSPPPALRPPLLPAQHLITTSKSFWRPTRYSQHMATILLPACLVLKHKCFTQQVQPCARSSRALGTSVVCILPRKGIGTGLELQYLPCARHLILSSASFGAVMCQSNKSAAVYSVVCACRHASNALGLHSIWHTLSQLPGPA